jgi:hypothetical protein
MIEISPTLMFEAGRVEGGLKPQTEYHSYKFQPMRNRNTIMPAIPDLLQLPSPTHGAGRRLLKGRWTSKAFHSSLFGFSLFQCLSCGLPAFSLRH